MKNKSENDKEHMIEEKQKKENKETKENKENKKNKENGKNNENKSSKDEKNVTKSKNKTQIKKDEIKKEKDNGQKSKSKNNEKNTIKSNENKQEENLNEKLDKENKQKNKQQEILEKDAKINQEYVLDAKKMEKIENEIKKNKNKSKKNLKKETKYKKIIKNMLIAICITIYFGLLILGKDKIPTIEYITDLKTFIIFEVIVSIIIYERAYKKDNDELALHGIELDAIAGVTLVILNLFARNSEKTNLTIAIGIFTINLYYLIKCAIIAMKKEKTIK